MRWGVLVVAVLSATSPSYAEDPKATAKRLFDSGRVLYDQGKFVEACVIFRESYQLDPAVGTQLNLAECAERDNKPRAAWLLWIAAATQFDEAGDRARGKFARGRADALAPKLATVVVRVARPELQGLEISIAGRRVATSAEIVERLDIGQITITARAPNHRPFEKTVGIAIGGKLDVDVPALEPIGGRTSVEHPKRGNVWWGVGITGGVLLSGGVVLLVYAAGRINTIEAELAELTKPGTPQDSTTAARIDALNKQGTSWEKRSYLGGALAVTGLVVGAAGVVKGVMVQREHRRATATLTPIVSPRLAGLQLDLAW